MIINVFDHDTNDIIMQVNNEQYDSDNNIYNVKDF